MIHPQPYPNLRLAWRVYSGRLPHSIFNTSLALCLAVTGILHILALAFKDISGITTPFSCIFLLLVLESEPASEPRLLWCQTYHLCLNSLVSLYFYTFLFSFLFRTVLIRYSERGLVSRGKPNLRLFEQLYWLLFSAFVSLAIILFSVVKYLKGNYPLTRFGSTCLEQPLENDDTSLKNNAITMAPVIIGAIFKRYWSSKVSRYLAGICPRGRMAMLGRYKCPPWLTWFVFVLILI